MADEDGVTPLINAAWYGHTDVVKVLIDGGAEPDKADRYGETPLHKAAENGSLGRTDVVQFLINSGANLDKANNNGKTPLHRAAEKDNLEVVHLLIEKGAKPDSIRRLRYRCIVRCADVMYSTWKISEEDS